MTTKRQRKCPGARGCWFNVALMPCPYHGAPEPDPYASAGLDVGGLETDPGALPVLVRCSEDLHDIEPGTDCHECNHGCSGTGKDCPGRVP